LVLVLRHATTIPPLRFEIAKPSDDVSHHAVLVLSSDALAAALLGAAVEFAGHVPHFARQGEPARTALLRVRPKLVLIDCDHEESCTDEFVGPALMTGGKVLLFRSRRTEQDRTAFADRLSLRVVDMPLDHTTLTTILKETLGD
jgi:chemotaxis response regulator CheB